MRWKKLWITQFLRNLNFIKYFEIELNQMTITQNDKHEIYSSMQLLKDNQIVNLLIKNAHIHEKLNHIDVIYHNIKDLHQKNLIQLNYVSNANMIIDNLIKLLSRNKFKKFVKHVTIVHDSRYSLNENFKIRKKRVCTNEDRNMCVEFANVKTLITCFF